MFATNIMIEIINSANTKTTTTTSTPTSIMTIRVIVKLLHHGQNARDRDYTTTVIDVVATSRSTDICRNTTTTTTAPRTTLTTTSLCLGRREVKVRLEASCITERGDEKENVKNGSI